MPAPVMAHMEFHRQAVWPELAVEVTSITDQWAGMALAGPRSRAVLARAVAGAAVDDQALPFMGVLAATIAGCPVLLLRISFSGELAYEIHTPAGYGTQVWQAVLAAGAAGRHRALRHRGDGHAPDREGPCRRRRSSTAAPRPPISASAAWRAATRTMSGARRWSGRR